MTADLRLRHGLIVAVLLALAGCGRPAGHVGGPAPGPAGAFVEGADVPTGDLAGAAQSTIATRIDNPLVRQPTASAQGKALFEQMNCAGCHGYNLGGAMGPNLTDRYWRYGGTPGAIYQSIADGRPQGMPAWRRALPPAEIWKLVSYIQSYGGATPAADYQAGEQGDVAARPVTPAVGTAPNPGQAAAKSAHP